MAGSQQQVVRLFASLIILLDERFLSRQAVHRPLVRLMRICIGDEFFGSANHLLEGEGENEDEEVKAWRRFGRDGSAEMLGFEEDLVDMMCHVASRLRNTPELLIIFFRDRGGDAEAKRAFDRALTGSTSPASMQTSRASTRPTSPTGSSILNPSATVKANIPAVSSPLRPPESLPVLPRKNNGAGDASSSASASTSLTYDFPLFSYLLRFVHRESRTGELARAGLLFLVDVAFAPGRRNLSRARRREGGLLRGQAAPRGARGGTSSKRGSGRPRAEVDFGNGPSLALARYMVESDFAEVLGASLGAVYGLLPGKISVSRQSVVQEGKEESSGMSLGGSILPNVEAETLHQRGIELNTSEEVRKQARLLCDLLEFTQDILRTTSRMPGEVEDGEEKKQSSRELVPIAVTLTESIGASIQKLYLESILYPSLLECSDVDGSAVAVMTYLDVMLGVLESDGVLAEFIIGWLVGEEDDEAAPAGQAKKRKSTAMMQLERERGRRNVTSAYFSDALGRYTVKDLLLDYFKTGTKSDSVIAALGLASTLFTYHGRFTLQSVLRVHADDSATAFPNNLLRASQEGSAYDEKDNDDDSDSEEFVYPGASKEEELFEEKLQVMARHAVDGVSIAQHTREMGLYLSLARVVERGMEAAGTGEEPSPMEPTMDNSSTGFDNYLDDAEQGLIRDSMYWQGLCAGEEESQRCFKHRVVAQDPLLRSLIDLFCQYWQNPPEVNVALTGFLTVLAMCPMRSLDGFLVFERGKEGTGGVSDTGRLVGGGRGGNDDDRSDDEKEYAATAMKRVADSSGRPPIVLSVVRSLVVLLDQYRPEVAGFDRMLRQRRKGLLFVENLSEALQLPALPVNDNGESAAPLNSMARYEPPDGSLTTLWQSVRVDSDVVEAHVPSNPSSRAKHISLPPPPSASEPQLAPKSAVEEAPPLRKEGFTRFFGRASAKKPAAKATEAAITSPPLPRPFAQHYQETSSIYLAMDRLSLSSKSAWSPRYKEVDELTKPKEKRTRFKDVDGDSDDDNVMYPGGEDKEGQDRRQRELVNLSALLDNAVVLEEAIKELAAILQVRRAHGIDVVHFV